MGDTLSCTGAANLLRITRQAIHIAIMVEKLKASYVDGHWEIKKSDLEQYVRDKYDRKKTLYKGQKQFDVEKGTISLPKAAQNLKMSYSMFYYLVVKLKKIPYKRKGAAYVLKIADINEYAAKHLEGKQIVLSA